MLERNWRLLALAPLLATPCWAHGAQTHDTTTQAITVEAQHETVGQWSQRVGRSLNNEIVYPVSAGRDEQEGLAKVSFHCSEDGKPGDITVLSSSGSHELDRAAMRAVKRIPTLHPLPEGIGHDRPFQAWVAFALAPDSLKKMVSTAHHDADQMNARIEQDRTGHQVASNTMPIVIAAN